MCAILYIYYYQKHNIFVDTNNAFSYNICMNNILNTLEDCIEALDNRLELTFEVHQTDYNLIHSLASQVAKGVAFTDKQRELAMRKISDYRSQFGHNGYSYADIQYITKTLRMPLRTIDRSCYIKLTQRPKLLGMQDQLYLEVRFPFSKNTIKSIETIKKEIPLAEYKHDAGSHTHFFLFNEHNVFYVVTELLNKKFDIDSDIMFYYKKLKQMSKNAPQYLPGIYDNNICNVHANTQSFMINLLGEPNKDNIVLYKDRARMLGLVHFDQDTINTALELHTPLTNKIVNRRTSLVFANNSEYSLSELVESVTALKRFPILVSLSTATALEELQMLHGVFADVVGKDESSVLFRMVTATDSGVKFNQYVKDHNLNNPVDKNTKIVYISKTKLPKPLVKQTEWKHSTSLTISSIRTNNRVAQYEQDCDLIIHYDSALSLFYKHNTGE